MDTGWKITDTFPQGGKIAQYKLCLHFPIMFSIELDLYCHNLTLSQICPGFHVSAVQDF